MSNRSRDIRLPHFVQTTTTTQADGPYDSMAKRRLGAFCLKTEALQDKWATQQFVGVLVFAKIGVWAMCGEPSNWFSAASLKCDQEAAFSVVFRQKAARR